MSDQPSYVSVPVPHEQRQSFWAVAAVMLGVTFSSAQLMVGATLRSGCTFSTFCSSTLTGSLLLSIYACLLAGIAAETGCSIHLLARQTFGHHGSWITSCLLAFSQSCWFVIGIAMFANPVRKYLAVFGWPCATWVPAIFVGILLSVASFWGMPLLIVISGMSLLFTISGSGFSVLTLFMDNPEAWSEIRQFTPESNEMLSFTAATGLAIGAFISLSTCAPDFARFAQKRRSAVTATALAFVVGMLLTLGLGALSRQFYVTHDISEVMVQQGMLALGIMVLGLTIFATNSSMLYSSSLGLATVMGKSRRVIAVINGIIGTIAALWLYQDFSFWLPSLNDFLPPIGAIIIADYYVVRDLKSNPQEAIGHGLPALLAWAVGTGAAIIFRSTRLAFPAFNGMFIAVLVYFLLVRYCLNHPAAKKADI